MTVKETPLKGCYVLIPNTFKDTRGQFYEHYNQNTLKNILGFKGDFVQDNVSISKYGVIRGLHGQSGVSAQTKLVSVSKGRVLDVAVDFRKDSPTFLQHFSILLDGKERKQLFIPKGFLHGFSVLSEHAQFFYKCDNFYNPTAEFGIRYDDPALQIDWKIPDKEQILSDKDLHLPYLKQCSL